MKILKKEIYKVSKNSLMDFALLLLGATMCALAFNLFFLPNEIVVGFSGLSIIANRIFGIDPNTFLYFGYAILVVLSLIILGWKSTKRSIIGSILYPFLVSLTAYIVPYVQLDNSEIAIIILFGGTLMGFGSGLVYKAEYSTGGSDVINQILSKFIKRPIGTCIIITNCVIISLGFLAFGINTVIYALVTVYIMSVVIDKVMIGISQSKTFNVITENEDEVKKFLLNEISHGVTVTKAVGGYTGNSVNVIMCVVPTKEYIKVKHGILNLDKNALILVSDVYEVIGQK